MAKSIVFLTGEDIGANASDNLHLYRKIVSFRRNADVTIITQCHENYPELAGCRHVVHLNDDVMREDTARIMQQADMFVVVGISPNVNLSANLLGETKPECCIAIINNGWVELPEELQHKNVVKMRDMSIGTGLTFLSVYWYLKDLVEE